LADSIKEELNRRATVTGKHALRAHQLRQLLDVIDDPKRRALIATASGTGIRREDVVRLEVPNLQLVGQDPQGVRIDFYEQKKDRPWRSWLPPDLAQPLRSWLQHRSASSRFVWPSTYGDGGGAIAGRTAYNWFEESLDRAGLDARPFHALRATAIKILDARGWSDEEISEQTGDSITVIREHYMTPTEQDMKERSLQTRFLSAQSNNPDG
jgi:integrase